jgi:hypothetical protein
MKIYCTANSAKFSVQGMQLCSNYSSTWSALHIFTCISEIKVMKSPGPWFSTNVPARQHAGPVQITRFKSVTYLPYTTIANAR